MKHRKRVLVVCLFVLVVSGIWVTGAQISSPPSQTRSDTKISSSNKDVSEHLPNDPPQFILVAKFIEMKTVRKKDYLNQVLASNDLSKAIGGRVFSFQIEKIICQSQNSRRSEKNLKNKSILKFFDKDGSGFYQPFSKGESYRLSISNKLQPKIIDQYELEAKTDYFPLYVIDGNETIRLVSPLNSTSENLTGEEMTCS